MFTCAEAVQPVFTTVGDAPFAVSPSRRGVVASGSYSNESATARRQRRQLGLDRRDGHAISFPVCGGLVMHFAVSSQRLQPRFSPPGRRRYDNLVRGARQSASAARLGRSHRLRLLMPGLRRRYCRRQKLEALVLSMVGRK